MLRIRTTRLVQCTKVLFSSSSTCPPLGRFHWGKEIRFFSLLRARCLKRLKSRNDNSSYSIIRDEFARVWNVLIKLTFATIINWSENREAAPRQCHFGVLPETNTHVLAHWQRHLLRIESSANLTVIKSTNQEPMVTARL
jgi:hypothetical protein